MQMPMGYYARQADLIAIATIAPPQPPDYVFQLKLKEVLRRPAQAGETIVLKNDWARNILPNTATTAAVLLKKSLFDKKSKDEKWEVLESYVQPEEIEVLHILLSLYALPTERQQLIGLQSAARIATAPTKPLLQKQLVADLREMREPANFDCIASSLLLLETKLQSELLATLGTINDRRGVPILLAEMQSPDTGVKANAARTVSYYFPGAPGVEEAMRRALQDETLKRTAQIYLSRRDATISIDGNPTPYFEAKSLLSSGQKAAAVEAYLKLLEGQKPDYFLGILMAEEILPFLDTPGKARLRQVLIQRAGGSSTDLQAEALIKLLRAVPHPDTVPALLALMHDPKDNPYVSWENEARAATFALYELGPEARNEGTARVLQKLNQPAPRGTISLKDPLTYLLQLAWLADDATWQALGTQKSAVWYPSWLTLAPLRAAVTSKDEGRQLAELLNNAPDTAKAKWIMARLGDLREPTAIAPLVRQLALDPWRYAYAPKDALVRIGGPQVEAGALELLTHPNSDVRRQAMDLLHELLKENARPLWKRVLQEENFGDKPHAAFLLGYTGTQEDLPLLLPLTDFWKTDRAIQREAVGAVAQIRARLNLDINGPIRKAA